MIIVQSEDDIYFYPLVNEDEAVTDDDQSIRLVEYVNSSIPEVEFSISYYFSPDDLSQFIKSLTVIRDYAYRSQQQLNKYVYVGHPPEKDRIYTDLEHDFLIYVIQNRTTPLELERVFTYLQACGYETSEIRETLWRLWSNKKINLSYDRKIVYTG